MKFEDDTIRAMIYDAATSSQARKLARKHKSQVVTNWRSINTDTMRRIVYNKFTQNKVLGDRLLATGDAVLVEDARWDAYWGNGKDGTGDNMMGQILMKVRHELRVADVPRSTRVVNIRGTHRETAPVYEVYIGRQCNMGGWNLTQSKWYNPYSVGADGNIDQVLLRYRDHILQSPLYYEIEELRGRVLGCWCKPNRCHGDVLIAILDAIDTLSTQTQVHHV
jgi:hypothetical protein